VSQEKLDGEWVEFSLLYDPCRYRSDGKAVQYRRSPDRFWEPLLPLTEYSQELQSAYHAAKSTQSADRISEERDLLRKALEGAVWSLEKLLEGSSEETVCGWVACVADLKQAREVLALTKSERGEKE
jgi:hypothetical protein